SSPSPSLQPDRMSDVVSANMIVEKFFSFIRSFLSRVMTSIVRNRLEPGARLSLLSQITPNPEVDISVDQPLSRSIVAKLPLPGLRSASDASRGAYRAHIPARYQ